MTELADLYAIHQGEESPEDYIWYTNIPVPNHPLKNIEIKGTSPEHCMEKARRIILDWRSYFGWHRLVEAEEIAKANCKKL